MPANPDDLTTADMRHQVEVAPPDQAGSANEPAPANERTPANEPAPASDLARQGEPAGAQAPAAAPAAAAVRPDTRKPGVPRVGLPARTTPPPISELAPLDAARRVVEFAEDKKAADIVLLEIAPLTSVADYLVICSGGSERQLDAIADAIVEGLKHEGLQILGREGEPASHWILVDAGSVIVHIFAPPEREFYGLEKLWAEARTVLSVQ